MNVMPLFAVLFASPLALLAVAGGTAAVPIIIHLLNRKRYVVINWAAMRFLLVAQKKNTRRLKLEQWFLLALRVLLLLLVVAAMVAVMPWVEPLWQRLFPGAVLGPTTQGRTHRIIVLDGSFSMATKRADEQTRFDVAKAQAKAVLEKANPGDGFSLVFLTTPAQVIISDPADDREKVAREIDELQLPHGSADVFGGLHAVAELTSKPLGKYARRDIYLISDLRRSAWPMPLVTANEAPALTGQSEAWARIVASARVIGIDVAGREQENLAVTGVILDEPLPMVGVDMVLKVTLHNYGPTPKTNVPVDLYLGKAGDKLNLVPLLQKFLDVGPRSTATLTIPLDKQNRFREPGDYVLQVRAGDDALGVDNTRALAVHVRDRIPVMLVNGKPAPEPLDRASEFLKRALNPSPKGEPSPITPATVRVLYPREFQDAGLGDLFRPDDPIDVVCLCDVPTIGSNEAARLETHLKRGGSVVIGLGPNASKNMDAYNRVLFNDGKGLLPGPLVAVKKAEPKGYFTLLAPDDGFKLPPLAGFRTDEERGSLATPYFDRYVQLDLPPNSPARRILSFMPSNANNRGRLDPAVVEYAKHRGKVIVFTSSLNADWNEWPRTLSFPPFVQELLRYLVAGNTRPTLLVGEGIDQFTPLAYVGLTAQLKQHATDDVRTTPVVTQDEAGVARFTEVTQAGIYTLHVGDKQSTLFAVNVPLVTSLGGAESDLARWTASDFKNNAPDADLQIVTDANDIQSRPTTVVTSDGDTVTHEARGPGIARLLLFAVLFGLLLETFLAWYYGSARAGNVGDPMRVQASRWASPLWLVPLFACGFVLFVVLHAAFTGRFLGFLPMSVRSSLEQMLGVPAAAPGEGTRWQLETLGYLTGDLSSDRWLVAALVAVTGLFAFIIYRRERTGTATQEPSRWRRPKPRMFALRFGILALVLLVLLPQAKLAFEREGWPDVVLIIDESRSMATVDTFTDPLVKAHAEELKQEWATLAAPKIAALEAQRTDLQAALTKNPDTTNADKLRSDIAALEARLQDLRTPHRLNLVKALLAKQDGAWLQALLKQRQMRVHVYRAAGPSTQMAELNDATQCAKLLADLMDVVPNGESSEHGTNVAAVLKSFRGRSLNAIILCSDGVTTKGDDLPRVAKSAARAGVPLFLIGVGDATEAPDLYLSELRAEDVIHLNDRLVVEAKVTAQGPGMPEWVPVVLAEMKNGVPVEIARETVRVSGGQPVKVKFVHQPKESGEKLFVITVPTQPDEADLTNNRIEHRVFVAEAQQLRVLLAEGTPRYDYRYVKALFERESDNLRGTKPITLDVFLASASPDAPKQDRTMLARFPSAEELKVYDVVILGDFDVKLLPKGDAIADTLAKYVKEHGGGLLMLAGDQVAPHCFRDTALADIMPVTCEGPSVPVGEVLKETYRPKLTPAGQAHPLFRFSTDDTENLDIWNQLTPMLWYAKNYRRKLSAEVLAVHPERAAEGMTGKDESHPLVLQQFVGAGRVLFLGFDETWRWRLRQDEPRFNQFWIQAVRVLAKSRIARIDIRTDRKTYRRDEPMRVTVRFPEGSPPPTGPVNVTLERVALRKNAKGEIDSQTIQLARRDGTHATYEGLITRTPEGDYTFTLPNPPPNMGRPKAEAKVLPPPGELDRVQLAEADMKRAATEARGQYFTLLDAENLADALPNSPRVALDQPCPPLVLWNHPLLFALVLAVLTAEWVLRKKWRLL